jgi:predicted transcriptional regulator
MDKKYSLCDLPLHRKYRSHFEIIALMLESVKDADATGFSIMTYSNTNSKQLERYLQILRRIGFINMVVGKDQVLYRTSEAGLEFLRQYYVLLGMLLGASARIRSTTVPCDTPSSLPSLKGQHPTQVVAHLKRIT